MIIPPTEITETDTYITIKNIEKQQNCDNVQANEINYSLKKEIIDDNDIFKMW